MEPLPVRKTDPETSYRAAKKILPKRGKVAKAVWLVLVQHGPMTQDALIEVYRRNTDEIQGWPPASDSSIRTRCSELVRLGLVEQQGDQGVSNFGNRALLWRARSDEELWR